MVFKIGFHVSISGKLYKAFDREKELGGNCGQIFVKSPRSWNFGDLNEEEVEEFKKRYDEGDFKPFLSHATYLINLATPKEDLFEKSLDCLRGEILRTDKFSLPYITFHPGAHTGSGEGRGIKRIIEGLGKLEGTLKKTDTMLLLENTAGKGTTLGYSMEQLERMIERIDTDIGVCLDTAHAYGAGYDLATEEGMNETLDEIDDTIGRKSIRIIHLNDSKAPLGSQKDQHAHLGEGEFGLEGIKRFINHEFFRDIPMIRESPISKKDIELAKKLRE
ncbi:MAG: deoxyribonuclease IV [archaeon]